MSSSTDDTPWYESMWSWFGDTAKEIYTAKLESDVAKEQADALAKEQVANETISVFGYDVHKNTLLWAAGGTMLAVLLILAIKK